MQFEKEIKYYFRLLFFLFKKLNELADKFKEEITPAPGPDDEPNYSNIPQLEEEKKKKTKYSKKASSFIGKEISHLKKDKGYPQDRAVAAAINVAKEKGMKVGTKKKKSKA